MKTLSNICNFIACFSYTLFLAALSSIILNVLVHTSKIKIANWKQELFQIAFLIVAMRFYSKTYKYLIE